MSLMIVMMMMMMMSMMMRMMRMRMRMRRRRRRRTRTMTMMMARMTKIMVMMMMMMMMMRVRMRMRRRRRRRRTRTMTMMMARMTKIMVMMMMMILILMVMIKTASAANYPMSIWKLDPTRLGLSATQALFVTMCRHSLNLVRVSDGLVANLVQGIRSVGNQLPEEDLFVGIERVDDQAWAMVAEILLGALCHMDEQHLRLYGKSKAANESFSSAVSFFWLGAELWWSVFRHYPHNHLHTCHALRPLLTSTYRLRLEYFMFMYTMPSESAGGCHPLISLSFNLS